MLPAEIRQLGVAIIRKRVKAAQMLPVTQGRAGSQPAEEPSGIAEQTTQKAVTDDDTFFEYYKKLYDMYNQRDAEAETAHENNPRVVAVAK